VSTSPLLTVRDLSVDFPLPRAFLGRRRMHRAVDGVSFDVHAHETLGLVGESGSGKSTIGRAILGLVRPTEGTITFDGVELTSAPRDAVQRLRPQMQVVFQNPFASLNPALTVGDAIGEPLRVHKGLRGATLDAAVAELLRQVGLAPGVAGRYPRSFSGGQRQRIAVARAIALRPRLLIADEPVSSLDVSTRGQIINLLEQLGTELGLADLFIGHDLAVVRHISDRIAVMHRGQLVELGPADEVADHPRHPYTQRLVAAVPVADPSVQARRRAARQGASTLDTVERGCRYASRCDWRMDVCTEVDPGPRVVGGVVVRCHLYQDIARAPVSIGASEEAVGRLVAARVLDRLSAAPADRPFALACPAGRTPLSTYAALGRLAAEREVDLSRVVITMMDEYVHHRAGGIELCAPSSHYSCRRYVDDQLLPLVNADLPPARRIRPGNVRLPDPTDPSAYERQLADGGGIDVVLLASGASDGHVAFNPPGSARDSITRVVALAESTRRDNLDTFPEFSGLDAVPEWGVTIGLGTILRARHAVMMLLGRGKSAALGRLLACEGFDASWPASIIFEHPDPWIVVDHAAAGGVSALEGLR
jgi:oligopeptide/dipeptide ABC transporter ATP-binding protein